MSENINPQLDPEFERELRQALQREDAPDWFEQGVMARVRAQRKPKPVRMWARWMAAAAMVVVMVGGVRLEQQRRERVAGEQAKEKLMLALQVTGSKLRMTQERVFAFEERRAE